VQDSLTIEEPAIKKQEEEKKLEVESSPEEVKELEDESSPEEVKELEDESSPEEVKELEDESNLEERQTGISNLSKNNRQEQ